MKRDVTEALYRQAFAVVGYDLTSADRVPGSEIVAAEARLGCAAPAALRAFYQLAGNARRMLDHYDHLLPPIQWSIEDGKLVFLAENQAVVLYAVDSSLASPDPPVLMTNNQDPFEWYGVCRSCSEFLRVMVHWEGSFGGAMPVAGSGLVDQSIRETLATRFQSAGEVNEMWAYGAPNLAVCLVKWDDGWRIFVGASSDERLADIGALGVDLEIYD
jgi:hypothetical protein